MVGANSDDLVEIANERLNPYSIFSVISVHLFDMLQNRALIVNQSGTILDVGEDRRAMRVKTIRCWRDHWNLIVLSYCKF